MLPKSPQSNKMLSEYLFTHENSNMLTNAPIGIYSTTPGGRFLSANNFFSRMLGYENPEELMEHISDITRQVYVNPEDRKEVMGLLTEHGMVANFECQWVRRNGSVFWVSISSRAVLDHEDIICCRGFVSDISERKQAEEALKISEDRYLKLFEASPISLWEEDFSAVKSRLAQIQSENGKDFKILLTNSPELVQELAGLVRVINVNQTTLRLYKARFRDFLTAGLNKIFTRRSYAIFLENLMAIAAGAKEFCAEEEHRTLDGEKLYVQLHWSVAPGYEDSYSCVLVSILDITRSKQAEEKLKRLNAVLRAIREVNKIIVQERDRDVLLSQTCRVLSESLGYYNVWIALFDDKKNISAYYSAGLEDKDDLLKKHLKEGLNLHCMEAVLEGKYILTVDNPKHDCIGCPLSTGYQNRPGLSARLGYQDRLFGLITASTSRDIIHDHEELELFKELIGDISFALHNLEMEEEHRKTEEELRRKDAMLRIAGDLARLGGWSVDFSENRMVWSDQLAEIHEMPPGYCPAIEESFSFYAPEFQERIKQVFSSCINEGVHYDEEMQLISARGRKVWVRTIGVAEKNESGDIVCVHGGLQDITDRKLAEEQLMYMSLHDRLTGLYNRTYLENEMQRISKGRDYPVTIISMDVDGLKLVNDSLGHDHGDRLLKQSADLLKDSLRKSDILARFGGDEFIALMPRTGYQAARNIVKRIKDRIAGFNKQNEQDQLPLSISIGMSVAESSDKDLYTAFKEADDLMYRDKLAKEVTARSQILRSLMAALEERDFITSGHAYRLENLCRKMGERLGLSEIQLSNLVLLAQVHDLGKVGIPDHILFKKGPLTEEEWKVMRQHPEKGCRIAQCSNELSEIADLILKHHERRDGQGYPHGLSGEDIPIESRILAIADAYDAMTSDRPYRKAMSSAAAVKELKKCAGTQFDPHLVEVFLRIIDLED